jgi:hypothetical protein
MPTHPPPRTWSSDRVSLNVTLGFSTSELAHFIGSSVDFGDVIIGINGSESLVHELVLVDPGRAA